MRARFLEQQPPVRIVEKEDKVFVYLCLNETVFEETYNDGDSYAATVYEYDYHEFVDDSENVDAEDITQNPEKYMGYVPKTGTLEEQLAEMRTQLEIINRFIAEGGTT